MRFKLIALACFLCIVLSLNAQGLREMEAKPMKTPAVYTVFLSNPEDGALVIYSTIPNLKFDSNMKGIVKTTEKPDEGKYVLFLKTMTSQIIIVKAMGYVECHIPVRNLQAQEGRYYSVEPKLDADDIGYGSLSLDTTPSGASVKIEGIPHGKLSTPYREEKLMSSLYNIAFTKERYQDKDILIRVEKNKETNRNITLDPNWADLTITSEPNNCRVYLDNALVGSTPLSYRGIQRGLDPKRYNIRIEKPNEFYLDGTKTLELKAMDDIKEHFALEDISGYLNFAKANRNYNIYINDVLRGSQSSNQKVQLIQGNYQIRCEVAGSDAKFYQPWSTSIILQKSDNIDIVPVLEDISGYLNFAKVNKNYNIYINNVLLGSQTSNKKERLIQGNYQIRCEVIDSDAEFYKPWTTSINLQKSDNIEINPDLVGVYANLTLRVNTSEVEVFLNNKKHDVLTSRFSSKVHPNDYTIKVKKIGEKSQAYTVWQEKISLQNRDNKVIDVQIEPIQSTLILNSNVPKVDYTIVDKELNKIVATGTFNQYDLLLGDYEITGKAKGYKTYKTKFSIKEQKRTELNIKMQEGSDSDVPANMVLVEGGTFQMGGDGEYDGKPVHSVTVSSFYIGKYEVTQKEWKAVMGNNPSWFKRFWKSNRPVERVSWYDAIKFCNKLSKKEGLTPAYTINGNNVTCDWSANGYRLPTEAEWEYAARGGNQSQGYTYSGSNTVGDVAWYSGNNTPYGTKPVGTKAPNELGIYDMSGNVWEWCWDWYGPYSSGSQTNPKGADSGSLRVIRGGSWSCVDYGCRVADRDDYSPGGSFISLGLRVLRTIQ